MDVAAVIEIVLESFKAVENRDREATLRLFHPEFEIHWPDSLPYGGTKRGIQPEGITWSGIWDPLQPTASERAMDPRVVAARGDEVVVHWRQRGVNRAGEHFDDEVLGLYKVRDGKLARAQMFYFDTAAVAAFLARS